MLDVDLLLAYNSLVRGQRQQLIFALRLDSLDVFAYMLLPNQLRLAARLFDSIAP